MNPNFWPHSFNFKEVKNSKKNNFKYSKNVRIWENSFKWIKNNLNKSDLSIQNKKNIFIEWVKTNNELWEKVMDEQKIKNYYKVKSKAWRSLISFLNKYNEAKSNIISDKKMFKIYKIKGEGNKSNYNSDYILSIKDIFDKNNKNYILLFCVKSVLNDRNKKLLKNPTKFNEINYLYLTLKSIQIRNNYKLNKHEELSYTNIFLNER